MKSHSTTGSAALTTGHADFVVVGCGVAGLRAAIEAGRMGTVLVLAKGELTDSATEWAQGGIAAALSDEDEISLHEQDTINAGDGLCNVQAVRALVEEGPKYIQELIDWGTQFDRAGTKLAFTREGAHSRSRVLHAHGDSTGREISRTLFARARTLPNISIRAHAFTTELVVEQKRVVGLRFLDQATDKMQEIRAAAVLLATGGLGQVYRETTNPPVATGDGMAIAYQAGAVLSDLEFVQFHPTALAVPGAPHFLLSEALRGEGGILRNAELHRFMKHYHEAGELATRDVVARAMVAEMQRTRTDFVYLDMTAKDPEYLTKRFPRIYATCQTYGVDITTALIPVRPAVHYSMGGVKTDLFGRTTLPGLYAAGETAATGVHGANRLASNSLLEGLVFGARTGRAMAEEVKPGQKAAAAAQGHGSARGTPQGPRNTNQQKKHGNPGNAETSSSPALEQIRTILWENVGIIRSGRGLANALEQFETLAASIRAEGNVARTKNASRAAHELHTAQTLGQLVARCALAREESRGSHYRSDFPFHNDEQFQKHSYISAGKKPWFE